MEKYWYSVLRHFEKRGYINNGLTIPYLVGSRTIIEPHYDVQTINEFLLEISGSEYFVTIMKCGNIGEYVIGLLDSESISMKSRYTNIYREFGSLVVTDDSFPNTNDFNAIMTTLIDKYADKVSSLTFSKEAGEWTYFTQTDLSRLKEIRSLH